MTGTLQNEFLGKALKERVSAVQVFISNGGLAVVVAQPVLVRGLLCAVLN